MLLPLLHPIMRKCWLPNSCTGMSARLCIVDISAFLAAETVCFFFSLGFPSAVLMWLIVIPAHSFMHTLSSSLSSVHISIFAPLPHPSPRFPSPLLQTQSSRNGTLVAVLCPCLMLVGCSQICLSSKQRPRLNTYLFSFSPPTLSLSSSTLYEIVIGFVLRRGAPYTRVCIFARRHGPFVLFCLYVFALSVSSAFHCCRMCNFSRIPEGGRTAQEAPMGDDGKQPGRVRQSGFMQHMLSFSCLIW